ncbi:hypothetical protein BS47DRAFT_1483825 [Hydnum rufescens UP504]|uniref:Fusaric acid resistance protein n=1 Tax=Hydnum rufescens UP504 TaxID=1448309 RepID=A0A9P6B2S5_9AGAM|nr:hypothetical protein BS47DRAFT_1483825 [Hydnum rufescens UP504]
MGSWKDLLFLEKFRRSLSRRVAFRCWLAGWLCALVLVISPVEHSAGQAVFLSLILVFIKPPAEPTIVFLAQSLFASVVLAITWAWCVLGLKFSNLTRDHQRDQRTANATEGSVLRHNPNATQAEVEGQLVASVFEGAFLQPGPSAIWGVFLFVGIYSVFLIRAYQVRLFFVMVFATVILSLFATFAPLIPIFYVLPLSELYLLPHVYYLAPSIFAALFVFPTSVAETLMETQRNISIILHSLVAALSVSSIAELSPSDVATAFATHEAQRGAGSALFDSATVISPYLGMEISVGNASGLDVKQLGILIRHISLTLGGFSNFFRHMKNRRSAQSGHDPSKAENEFTVDPLRELLLSLARTSSVRYSAIASALRTICSFYEHQTDWFATGFPALLISSSQGIAKKERILTELRDALAQLERAMSDDYQASLAPAASPQQLPITESEGGKAAFAHGITTPSPVLNLDSDSSDDDESLQFLHAIYLESLKFLGEQVLDLLHFAIKVEQQSTRLWFPGKQNSGTIPTKSAVSLGSIPPKEEGDGASVHQDINVHSNTQKDSDPSRPVSHGVLAGLRILFAGSDPIPDGEDDPSVIGNGITTPPDIEAGEGHALPSRGAFHALRHAIHCTTNTQSSFAFKVGLLAIALACPAWIQADKSAKFYFDNKGVWALITGLTAKGVYSSETTYGFIQRVIGAVIGGVTGLVMWYISTGSGNGNAYGLAAVCAVVLCYAMPYRIWHPNFLETITATTTAALVIGYSWVDATAPVAFNPGLGYTVFWRRLVLVLIGLTASWLIDLVPKPKTGREDLRITYSKTTLAIGSVTASVLARIKDMPVQPQVKGSFMDRIGPRVMSIHNKIRLSSVRISLAKLEPSIDRQWSEAHYLTLQRLQFEILDLLGVLAIVSRDLDVESRSKLLASPLFQKDQITSLLSLFYVASLSLHSEQPSPPGFQPHTM